MRRLVLVALVAAMLLTVSGCGTSFPAWTPKAQLAGSRDTFNATLNSLAVLRRAGAFTEKEGEAVTMYIDMASKILDRWEAAIELGQPTKGLLDAFDTVLQELVARRIAAERRVTG